MPSPSTELIHECASAGLLAALEQPKTILLIEDDPFVGRATCELLTNAGHHSIEAENVTGVLGVDVRLAVCIFLMLAATFLFRDVVSRARKRPHADHV